MRRMKTMLILSILLILGFGQVKSQNNVMTNGLNSKLKGKWINTALFDSTRIKKQFNPWLFQSYGDLILEVNTRDSVNLYGNMDGAKCPFELVDSMKFCIPDRFDNPKFEYDNETDLIIQNSTSKFPIVYRRIKESDPINIIESEELFTSYFIDLFFSGFKLGKNEKITDLWVGFETYFPFNFDAVGITDDAGEVNYFGWKIENDILYLYETSRSVDEESGFSSYIIGKLKRQIKKTAANNM